MLLSGLLEGHTRLLLSRTRKKNRTPHAHPLKQETTQPSNASKDQNKNNTPQRHENKRDRHSYRSTSRTQGRRDPFSLTPDQTRVLQQTKPRKRREKETDRQTRAPDPLQITQGQDQQWILTPESKCNGPGGPLATLQNKQREGWKEKNPGQVEIDRKLKNSDPIQKRSTKILPLKKKKTNYQRKSPGFRIPSPCGPDKRGKKLSRKGTKGTI